MMIFIYCVIFLNANAGLKNCGLSFLEILQRYLALIDAGNAADLVLLSSTV